MKSDLSDVLTRAGAFRRDFSFPSLRRRHAASNSALVRAAHTLPSSLCLQMEDSREHTIHIRGSSNVGSRSKSNVKI